MSKLKEFLVTKRPDLIIGDRKVYDEMSKKAQLVAKKYYPNDKEKMVIATNAYMLGMIDTVELIYN